MNRVNSHNIVLRLHRNEDLSRFALWWRADVMIAIQSDFIWARFDASNHRLNEQSLAMPADRFRLVGRWLIRDGQQVAEAELPELDWQPIAHVLEFKLPWIGTAGQVANLPTSHWQLTRGGIEQPIAGAIIAWSALKQWVESAPQCRLEQLRYCIAQRDNDHLALVLGTPIPPVDAQYLVAHQSILIPAGMHWLPAMDTENVQRSFGVQAGQWLLWRAADDWCLLDDGQLAALTRASVRLLAATGV